MSEKDKTLLIVILAVAALCGCFMISCCAASFFIVSHADKNTFHEIFESGIVENYTVDTQNDRLDENTPDTFSVDINNSDGLSEAEQKIIDETEKVRGLKSTEKLAPTYQSEEELREYLIDQLDEVSDEELADELLLYNVLGFAPKNFDLRQFYLDMYTEQIAGFYDPEENQMYLIKDDSPYENALTLSHEYTHFLQYNHPDFSGTLQYEDDFCEEHGETCLIINALIEGDATLTESLIDAESIIGNYRDQSGSSPSSNVYDNAPKYFQDSLLFPYVYGYDFVAYHYLKGGFEAVNDLFINLPQSVEQIMHPEKYLKDAPVEVTAEPFRKKIADEFDIIREDVLNEADIKMLLSDGYNENWQLSEQQASIAAEGWGGGSFIIAKNDGKPLFFSKMIWDTEKDAEEAETAFSLYSERRFGQSENTGIWKSEDSSSVYLIRQNDVLYWMILPDNFEAGSFISLLQNGSIL